MDTKVSPRDEHIESAADWVATLQSPLCTGTDRAAFERWLRDTPEAAEEYRRIEHIYTLSCALSCDQALATASHLPRRHSVRAVASRRRRWAWSLAAGLALCAIVSAVALTELANTARAVRYATATGEQRTLYFPDGTEVLLDTDSAVTVSYTAKQREVTLDRGRAQFDVAPDAHRPFLVRADLGVIRDVGTRFQVMMSGPDVTVALLSGEVIVSLPGTLRSSTLAPGEEVTYAGRIFGKRQPVDLAAAKGWTRGEMVFQNRDLSDVVRQMNRYSTQKIVLGDPSLVQVRVSGVLHAGDNASLLQGLEQGWGLRVRKAEQDTVVVEPPVASKSIDGAH